MSVRLKPVREGWMGNVPTPGIVRIIELVPLPMFQPGFSFQGARHRVELLHAQLAKSQRGPQLVYTCQAGDEEHRVLLPQILRYVPLERVASPRTVAEVLVKIEAAGETALAKYVVRAGSGEVWGALHPLEASLLRLEDPWEAEVTFHIEAAIACVVAHYLGIPIRERNTHEAFCSECAMFRWLRGSDTYEGDIDARRPSSGTGLARERGPWDESFWLCALGNPIPDIGRVVEATNSAHRSGSYTPLRLYRCGEDCVYSVSKEHIQARYRDLNGKPKRAERARKSLFEGDWVYARHVPPAKWEPRGYWYATAPGWDVELHPSRLTEKDKEVEMGIF